MSDRLQFMNVVEFYKSGTTRPFLRRTGLFNVPRQGESVDIAGVTGIVVTVNWNLDYLGKDHEQWRCNIYIDDATK